MIDRYAKNEGVAKNVLTKRVLKLKLCLWKDPPPIHTDIHYLTEQNSYIATLMGINGCTDFYQADLSGEFTVQKTNHLLSNRELQVLQLIG